MTKEQKEKWIAALRSGKYNQGTEALYKNKEDKACNKREATKYCCLGVACEIGITRASRKGNGYADDSFLPKATQKILAEMNDAREWSFLSISDYIEENVDPTE